MKVGILTFSCAHNYGAVLQCYALQETIKSMGHEVEVINYRPKYLVNSYKPFCLRKLLKRDPIETFKNLKMLFLTWDKRCERFNCFESFISQYIQYSPWNGDSANGIPYDYDAYVIGSDQIWNNAITRGWEPLYFAQFPFPKDRKIYITYAASMGREYFNSEEDKKYVTNALATFDAISVREDTLVKLLQPLTNKKVKVVLDPTLIVPHEVWSNIAVKPIKKKKMVLLYQVKRDDKAKEIAEHIAMQIKGEVVEIYANILYKYYRESISPAEFVGFFMETDYIVTTSFHGTAFSIICQKPFYTVKLGNHTDVRATSLLEKLGLWDRMVDKNTLPPASEVDFTQANIQLNVLRRESMNFLSEKL